ncbi:hypothetical protein OIV83_005845 [Microbotryomycetes sp. JL201]|nr:hypothetical protein OIV83_005845 [Microbotryomycetes sp. JL201]
MDLNDILHNNTSSPDRPFTCTYEGCQKSFSRRSDLVRHNRIHSNDRDFIQRSALKVHIRVHFCRKTTLLKHLKSTHPSSPGFSHAESWRAAQAELEDISMDSDDGQDEDEDELEEDGDEQEKPKPVPKSRASSSRTAQSRQARAGPSSNTVTATPQSQGGHRAPVAGSMVFISPSNSRGLPASETVPDLSNYRFGRPAHNVSQPSFAPPAPQGAFSYPMTPSSSTNSTSKLQYSPGVHEYRFPARMPAARQTSSAAMQHAMSNPLPIETSYVESSLRQPHSAFQGVHQTRIKLEPSWVPSTPESCDRSQLGDQVQMSVPRQIKYSHHQNPTSPTYETFESMRHRRASSTPAVLDSSMVAFHDASWHRDRFETGLGLDVTP